MKRFVFHPESVLRRMCAAALVLCVFSVLLPLKGAAEIYSSVLRFHVVSNSPAAEDVAIKEEVRELLLELTREGLSACGDRAEAAVFLTAQKEELLVRVNRFLARRGVNYRATAKLVTEHHAEKVYEDITLPHGDYLSFRVILGEGGGENFFCVLFPPICKKAAGAQASEVLADYGVRGGAVRLFKTGETRVVRSLLWERLKAYLYL